MSVVELVRPALVENETEYITLAEAAQMAGYSSPRTLQAAASSGRLKTRKWGPRATVTTGAWLQEYLDNLKESMSHRGQPREGDTPEDDGSNNH